MSDLSGPYPGQQPPLPPSPTPDKPPSSDIPGWVLYLAAMVVISLIGLVFYAVTETGVVNSYVHIWCYEDVADRAKKRAAMQADPGWQEFMKKSAELGALVSQTNAIMNEVPFFKPKR